MINISIQIVPPPDPGGLIVFRCPDDPQPPAPIPTDPDDD